jgi:hypothetical protein
MDIYLGDLYYRFLKLLKPELVSQLHDFFTAGTVVKQKGQAFVVSLKETAETYFETVAYFINGADGKFEPWEQGSGSGVQGLGKDIKKSVKHQDVSDNRKQKTEPWEEFKGYVERLIGLVGYLNATDKTPTERMLKELALRMKERQLVCAAALGYGLLSVLRSIIGRADGGLAANLAFEHWDLDRKLKEQFKIFGANDDEVWRLGEICKAVLYRTGVDQSAANNVTVVNKKAASFDAERFAASLIIENHSREDFRRLIGVNVFNDVTWFNKEAFESALFYGKLFFVLEGEFDTAHIAEITEAMKNAEIESGYRLDKFIQLLSGAEAPQELESPGSAPQAVGPKKPTAVKKPTAKKTPTPTAKTATEKKPAQVSQPKKTTAVKKTTPRVGAASSGAKKVSSKKSQESALQAAGPKKSTAKKKSIKTPGVDAKNANSNKKGKKRNET